jgi:ABC-type transporter Mla MlaB component
MKMINYTITPSPGNNKSVHLLLEGELTLGNTKEIVQKLAEAVEKYDSVKVEVKNMLNIDLTGVQLLFAIKHTAFEANKQCIFDIHLPEEVKIYMDHSGFNDLTTLLNSTN